MTGTRKPSDFVVVGGGPAGSAFAILAARAGASVTLVERSRFEQRRPGEYLAGRTRVSLDALGLRMTSRSMASSSPGILSVWNSSVPVSKSHAADGAPDALCVTRHLFDEMLFQAAKDAGAEVAADSVVGDIGRSDDGGWEIELRGPVAQRVFGRSVVDASGRSSIVARSQGASRINCGDLIAITGWLRSSDDSLPPSSLLTVESCRMGWWSLSTAADGVVVATLYTSAEMMRSSRASPEQWWGMALEGARNVGQSVSACDPDVTLAVFPAFPSRSSQVHGDGWIAVGEAAIALDPIAGKGVATAMETAFRAFEAATVDPSWKTLGGDYADALTDRFERHLEGRARVYEEAAHIFDASFLPCVIPSVTFA